MILTPWPGPQETLAEIEKAALKQIKKYQKHGGLKPYLPKLTKKEKRAQTLRRGQPQKFTGGFISQTFQPPPKKRVEHKAFIETRGRKPKYTTPLLKSLRTK